MIFTQIELREAIGSKDIVKYLNNKGYNYTVVGSDKKPLYIIQDKLKLKGRVDVEDVVKEFYSIECGMLDKAVDSIIKIYESNESINIKDLVEYDKELVDTLLQEEIIMYDFYNYNIAIRYSLLTKILEV